MELARSSYYYRPVGETSRKAENRAIRARLEELALRFPRYGYRRMTAQLKRDGFTVNHKRVLRIMREADLLCTPLRRKTRTTNSNHELRRYPNLYRNTIPIEPDRVWVGDLTYIPLPYGFAYLAVLLDACSRKVVGWGLSRRLDAKLTCTALETALSVRTPAEAPLGPGGAVCVVGVRPRC